MINKNKLLSEEFLFKKYIDNVTSGVLLTEQRIVIILQGINNYIMNTIELKKLFTKIGFITEYGCDINEKPFCVYSTTIEGKTRNALDTIDFFRELSINYNKVA